MLTYFFGDWTEWLEPQKFLFIPEEKIIQLHSGYTDIDVQIDLYSAWKEWIRYYDNSKWEAAFRTFGGDPTGENQFAPRYFFLINGWKVKVANQSAVFQLNLYTEDGSSPFIIENAAVTNRASDVPVIQSSLEERLNYGDVVYYDETSNYVGTDYPNGTIAQPVNNVYDAVVIASKYNIHKFVSLSDLFLPGIIGESFEDYSIIAGKENLSAFLYGNYYNNMEWVNFNIDGNFSGGTNTFKDCIITNALDVSGEFVNCQLQGTTRIQDSVVFANCYSGVAGASTPIFDMNENRSTRLSIRAYSGGVELRNCNFSGDTTTIELIAGQVKLKDTCTAGYIDIRGVGYLTDQSSGSTVKTSGFIDNLEEYLQESRESTELLAYGGKIYVDQISGSTGTTYPSGTIIEPVKDPFYLSEQLNIKEFHVVSDYIYAPDEYRSDVILIAEHPNINLTILSGQNIDKSKFSGFYILDAQFDGNNFNTFEKCIIFNINNFYGHVYDSEFWGDISVANHVDFWRCWADHYVNVYLTGSTHIDLGIVGWFGDLIFKNAVDSDISVNITSGKIQIESGCTGGVIDLRGVGYLENNAGTGCTVITTGFVSELILNEDKINELTGLTYETNQSVLIMMSGFTEIYSGFTEINQAISGMTASVDSLDEKVSYISGATYEMNQNVQIMTSGFTEINDSISGMTDSITVMSELVSDMYISVANMENDVKRILGLYQENFRITDHVYGSDNLLDSATIKIYNNSADCDADINPLATYGMIALYDAQGRLISYKVSKN